MNIQTKLRPFALALTLALVTMAARPAHALSLNFTKVEVVQRAPDGDRAITLYDILVTSYANRLRIEADVQTTDADGQTRTNHIVAILIGLLSPRTGLPEYSDDACMVNGA